VPLSRSHSLCCRDITVSACVQLRIGLLTRGRNSARATPRLLCPPRVRILAGVHCGCRAPKHLARTLSTPPLFKCTRIVPVEAFCSQQSARMGVSWLLSARAPSAREWCLLFPSVRTKSLLSHKQGVHSGVSWLLSARAPSAHEWHLLFPSARMKPSVPQAGCSLRCIVAAERPSP